ncbi:MAG TPA: hypothetical protein VFZ46_03385 [Nitrososphaeraceae archaeon]
MSVTMYSSFPVWCLLDYHYPDIQVALIHIFLLMHSKIHTNQHEIQSSRSIEKI